MMSVSVIGGYLGAGKTTLVNHLLRHANGTRIAVLVNEFGALPIDADLIEAQDETLISIAGGCVCCSYGNDLVQAMLDLGKLEVTPDHILIESSGVALPGAIAASISLIEGMQIDGVVVLCDVETILDQRHDPYIGDTIERQLAEADLLVLNKADLLSEAGQAEVLNSVEGMVPQASVILASGAKVPTAVVLQDYRRHADVAPPSSHQHGPSFESDVFAFDAPCDAHLIAEALAHPDAHLVRAKGFVPTSQGLRAVQVVGRRWSVTDAPDGVSAGLVAIAQHGKADFAALRVTLAALTS